MHNWQQVVKDEWLSRNNGKANSVKFPLAAQDFNYEEIIAAVDVLLSGRITMGEYVRKFEDKFAQTVGAKYAVMVNSGSSANLLALAVATNHKRKHRLPAGGEVLVPAVCWSTSVWPIKQMGLVPVFVDSDPESLNVCMDDLKRKATPKTCAIMAVHVLGNSAPMEALVKVCSSNNWLLIEDTCESLGSKAIVGGKERFLGTLGQFGTFSFYYSHHMTTGEGGMVVCDTLEDYDLLKCLRAHGWTRELSNRAQIEAQNPNINAHFYFVNEGFNFRPMEVQAAFGLCQIEKLAAMNRARVQNRSTLVEQLISHPKWKNQFTFPVASKDTTPAWFGFPVLMNEQISGRKADFLAYLTANGVENRPIISGNFARQPALAILGIKCNPTEFTGAEIIDNRGFFVGIHGQEMASAKLKELADLMLGYKF